MNHSELAGYFIGVIMLGLKPGPTVSSVIAYSFYGGGRQVPQLILGILSANVVLIIFSGLLRALGFSLSTDANVIASVLGSLSLLFIGLRLLFSSLRAVGQTKDDRSLPGGRSGFTYGFILHVSNPNTIIFFASLFLIIVPLNADYLRNVCILGSFALIVDAVILSTYASIVSLTGKMVIPLAVPVIGRLLSGTPIVASFLLIILSAKNLVSLAPPLLHMIHDFFYR